MNYEEVVAQNKEVIESSAFHAVTKDFVSFIEIYPPVTLTKIKDDKKMAIVCRQADKVYQYQTAFSSIVNDIHSSLILAGNEVVVPHFITEMAMFSVRLHRLTNSILLLATTTDKELIPLNQHLTNYFKQIKLKQKDIQSALVGDLKMMSEKFGFDVDIKESVEMYQSTVSKHVGQ